jgi:LPS-assembly lipoprotein
MLLCGALLLAGCGFQPRGQALNLSAIPDPIHIAGIAPHSPLARELRRQFQQAGVGIADSAADSASVLRISRRDSDSRVLSVDSRNKAVEYELEESARFALYDSGGEERVPPQTVRALRILKRPPDAILGADREKDLLRADMRRDLAERIARRLAAQR